MSSLLKSAGLTPNAALIAPVIGLNLWHFTMEAWMYATRITWFTSTKQPFTPGMTRGQFEAMQPPAVRYIADNYNHLFEQPTQFYAVSLTLALLGSDSPVDLGLAWAYVGGRVVHSFVQCLGNHVPTRFKLYILNSFVLLGMTVRAAVVLAEKTRGV